MKTRYEEIINVSQIGKHSKLDLNFIFSLAGRESFSSAADDSIKRLLLMIDVQNDFMEGGALGVPGSIGDVERITRFIYRNMGGISSIMCSLDTHIAQQIFHPCWWENVGGDRTAPPSPYTIISYEDVMNGYWRPIIGDPETSVQYLKELEKLGNEKLCIWPYHCIYGTEGAALENEFAKMVYFHSIARKSAPSMIQKGTDPFSEMYGIIRPEYSKQNYMNLDVLEAIEKFDEIYLAGEAASHCVKKSAIQMCEYFASRPEITSKITILEDCTSPIPGYEAETKATFEFLSNQYGVKIAKSTDIQF